MDRATGLVIALAALFASPGAALARQATAPSPAALPPDSLRRLPRTSDSALYVLDGRVIDAASMKNFPVDSIESVNVIKGKPAVDAYGQRARNGVIEIKTKGHVPPVSASHAQAAEALLYALGTDSVTQHTSRMLSAMRGQPGMAPQFMDALQEFYARYVRWEDIKPELVSIYAAAFTEAELRELTTVFRSPVGAKYVRFAPELSTKTMNVVQRLLAPHTQELVDIMTRRVSP